MLVVKSAPSRSWSAELTLGFSRREARTILSSRYHRGPLVIQKPLYPEGDEVCHTILIHPPAGVAGGDELEIDLRLEAGAQVLVTTPGAAKWYRSSAPWAHQRNSLAVAAGACLEWLPQETIVFNGALGGLNTVIKLADDASFLGWEIFCLGRTGSGESFDAGTWQARTAIERNGKPVWLERAQWDGGGAALNSQAILAGQPVAGTFVAVSSRCDNLSLDRCRSLKPLTGMGAVSQLPQLIVGRYLGRSSEAAKNYFVQLWRILRPAILGRPGDEPRIWRT
jgi:urease accessory protein